MVGLFRLRVLSLRFWRRANREAKRRKASTFSSSSSTPFFFLFSFFSLGLPWTSGRERKTRPRRFSSLVLNTPDPQFHAPPPFPLSFATNRLTRALLPALIKKRKKKQRESDILSSIDQPLPVYSVDGVDHSSPSGPPPARPRVVVLGSGWGSMSFVKALSKAQAQEIDLTVISPRNYFLYTPLLPAVATGTVEERSIVEPVRKVLGGKGAYFEAVCHSIDPVAKQLVCW